MPLLGCRAAAVAEILVHRASGLSWAESLLKVMPPRKEAVARDAATPSEPPPAGGGSDATDALAAQGAPDGDAESDALRAAVDAADDAGVAPG